MNYGTAGVVGTDARLTSVRGCFLAVLELLGLIVDLNQIHLQITADPNGAILGSTLCSLAPLTTTPATAATP